MVEIRRVAESDADALLDIFESVAAERIYIGTQPGFDRDRHRSDYACAAISDVLPGFVACEGARVVGYCSLYAQDVGYTCGILLARDARGRGIGRALMQTLIAWARDHRIAQLHLYVFGHNERALRLYRSLGFETVAEYPRSIARTTGEIFDNVHMRLHVP
jgi:ribosomal protein S18 acetylase RimI-like enzyme